ncbi:MAG: peptide ABC transporter substrate-binding protein [Cyanobacteria bacterium J06636_16]
MLQNFVPSSLAEPLEIPSLQLPAPPEPMRDPVRILVIGTPPGIRAICHSLHIKGFARLDEWSPLLPHGSGKYCRILTRQVPLE